MKTAILVSALLLAGASTALAAGSDPLQQLAVSQGQWVYHGEMQGKGKPTPFVWHADCRWSANRAFMMCSYSNIWGGKHINSLVVDTYNHDTQSFWHYEIFEDGKSPDKPFASKMRIDGPLRVEQWRETEHGQTLQQRIVYRFASDTKVSVAFEQSKDGKTWTTTATATGEKTGP